MKVLYFDCFSGISGNMVLGALLELGVSLPYLEQELKKVNVDGYELKVSKVKKNGIGATYVDVVLEDTHAHLHHHHRTYTDIIQIIDESGITENAKELAKAIFYRIAKAEAKVHQESIEQVHFHEVGAIDSIVDIIGASILIDKLNPDRIIASVVNDGHGFTFCQHGQIPIPVPATVEIFADAKVRSKQVDIDKELVTPTGAAIIAQLAAEYTNMPEMIVECTGYGAGKRDLLIPNVLRVVQGEVVVEKEDEIKEEKEEKIQDKIQDRSSQILVMETNIDDCSPEILGYTMECLLQAGAKDVFFTPIQMKKNRMATMLTVLCEEELQTRMEEIIFQETTTLGIRMHKEYRTMLHRKQGKVATPYGELVVKEMIRNGVKVQVPEYESAKHLALANQVPLQEIYKLNCSLQEIIL